jgi:hypothetical protein
MTRERTTPEKTVARKKVTAKEAARRAPYRSPHGTPLCTRMAPAWHPSKALRAPEPITRERVHTDIVKALRKAGVLAYDALACCNATTLPALPDPHCKSTPDRVR